MVVVPDLRTFRPRQVYVSGELVAEDGRALFSPPAAPSTWLAPVSDTGRLTAFSPERLRLRGYSGSARVIGMIADQIVTDDLTMDVQAVDGTLITDSERDLLKVAVV